MLALASPPLPGPPTEFLRAFVFFPAPPANRACPHGVDVAAPMTRAKEILEVILDGEGTEDDIALLRELGDTMKDGSLCALGGLAPAPVLTALQYFGKEFRRRSLPARIARRR